MSRHPFLADPPTIVPLATGAPLERVIAQVQFPSLHLGEKKGLPVAFHDLVRNEFPYSSETKLLQIEWTPQGGEPKQVEAQNFSYQFRSADKKLELTLGNNFLSLVSLQYDTREEFRKNFILAMAAAAESLNIVCWARLGLRYINRGPRTAAHKPLDQYLGMLKPEYRGIPGTPLSEMMATCLFSSEWELKNFFASVRHGFLAPGATYEPMSVPSSAHPGWVLDIDVFLHPERLGKVEVFSAEELEKRYLELANREYAIFRTLVTDEFLQQHGGRQ